MGGRSRGNLEVTFGSLAVTKGSLEVTFVMPGRLKKIKLKKIKDTWRRPFNRKLKKD